MNRISSVLFLFIALIFFGCSETSKQPVQLEGDVVNHTGVIQQVGADIYVIIDNAEEGTHYAPTNLPVDYKEDGLRVLFSGSIREIPSNVRMAGTPLVLSTIQRDIK